MSKELDARPLADRPDVASFAASFYRRPLPDGQVAFSSPEGRQLFREALADGHMEGWFALSEQFHTQADPAFCGLGTLVVVLNALEIDPGRIWKGPWRWYGEELLDCCQPLSKVQEKGVTIDELACLARCNGARATVSRASAAGVDQLRAAIRAATAAARGPVLVAGYGRAALGQTGGGHFSPIAGYHPQRDLALILDVARFKYPPHWVPLPALWHAMTGLDPATGLSRGWIVLERGSRRAMPLYFRLSAGQGVATLVAALLDETPALLASVSTPGGETPEALVAAWVHGMQGSLAHRLGQALRPVSPPADLPPEHRRHVEKLLAELRATKVHGLLRAVPKPRDGDGDGKGDGADFFVDVLATLLLALPEPALAALPASARAALSALRDPAGIGSLLAEELAALRDQLTVLREWSCVTTATPPA
jgi:glutathione gamma-glutamylcysteinyltransferase